MTRVVNIRKELNAQYQRDYGVKVSFMPFIMRAVIEAIPFWPWVNAEVRGDSVVVKKYVNLGVAVAIDDSKGLVVPVIHNAEEKNLLGLTRSLIDLADRARKKPLTVDEMSGGSFTITNPGVFGALFGTPDHPAAPGRDHRRRGDRQAPRRGHGRVRQRLDRDPLDDVPADQLRPSPDRWRLRGAVHAAGEEEPRDVRRRPSTGPEPQRSYRTRSAQRAAGRPRRSSASRGGAPAACTCPSSRRARCGYGSCRRRP